MNRITSVPWLFKRELLRSMFPTRTVVPHFMHGNRLQSIIHARLRNNCSDLIRVMLLNHLSDHDICSHCNIPETSDDHFFHCPIYSIERLHPLNLNILLFGDSQFTYSENITIVNAVYNYIKSSKRFTTQIFMFRLFKIYLP